MKHSLLPKPLRKHQASAPSIATTLISDTVAVDSNRSALVSLEGQIMFVTGFIDGFRFSDDRSLTCLTKVQYTTQSDSFKSECDRSYASLDHAWMDTTDFPKLPKCFHKVHIMSKVIQYQRQDGSISYGFAPVTTKGATHVIAKTARELMLSIKNSGYNKSVTSMITKAFSNLYLKLDPRRQQSGDIPITFANLGHKEFISALKKHERKLINRSKHGDKQSALEYLLKIYQHCIQSDDDLFVNRVSNLCQKAG